MKRVVAFLWVLVFICSNIVFAEDTTPRIDFSAMQWYAQATNAAAKRLGHPYTLAFPNAVAAYHRESQQRNCCWHSDDAAS